MQVIGFKDEIVQQIISFHYEAMGKIKTAFCTKLNYLSLIDDLVVEGSNTLRTCGGKALMTKYSGEYFIVRIKLNKRLHELNPNELRATYLHELAHIIANLLKNKQQGHNSFWKEVMTILGLEPDVYHEMDVSAFKAKVKRFKYICLICPRHYKLTVQKHNKHVKLASEGQRGYYCKCGRDLIFDTMVTI